MPRAAYKDNFTAGLEHVLNNSQASFMKSPHVFNEIHNKAGMSLTAMLRHVGKRRKNERNEPKKPNDAEKSEERLNKLEAASQKE